MRTILGIDPGSRITGYGIIRVDGDRYAYVGSGCVRVVGDDFASRLGQVFSGIAQVIEERPPDEAAIEQVFMRNNANSALKLGQARGAAIVAVAQAAIPLAEYSPRQIKQAVVGYGGADKAQVQYMIKTLLGLSEVPPTDAADALGVAICHAHFSRCSVTT